MASIIEPIVVKDEVASSEENECSLLDGEAAYQILSKYSVDITRKLNLTAIKPYLIKFDCITLEESSKFNCESQSENILKLIDIISKRGKGAFNGLLKALLLFTAHEPGERGHIELLETLKNAVNNKDKIASHIKPIYNGAPYIDEKPSLEIPQFIWLLKIASISMIVLSVPLAFAGVFIISFSIREFSGDLKCDGVGIAHSLSVFNFFFGILCLSVPVLLILLILYFKFEHHSTRWRDKYLKTKCVVWATIGDFLLVFILIIFELFYALLYIVPQVIDNYAEWKDSEDGSASSICDKEVYVMSFSIVTISFSLIFLLLIVLGCFLAKLYHKWVTDEDDPGTLRNVIYTVLQKQPQNNGTLVTAI